MSKVHSTISLAMKAGSIKSGEFAVNKALESGKVCLVIVDTLASEATKKRWHDACDFRKIPFIELDSPGQAIGKDNRMLLCVVSPDFARMILDALQI